MADSASDRRVGQAARRKDLAGGAQDAIIALAENQLAKMQTEHMVHGEHAQTGMLCPRSPTSRR